MQFTFPQKILFRHCDPAGIVFYPRYFEMINDCVEAFFDAVGIPFHRMHETGAVPTAAIEVAFRAPSRHGDALNLTLAVTRIGGSSLGLEIQASDGDELRFAGTSTLVYTNQLGRPQRWSDQMRRAFSPYLRSDT